MVHLLTLLLTALAAFATDVTGTWRGTLTPDGRQPISAVLVLRQEGSTVTGTAGESEEDRQPISHGTIKDDVVTFELAVGESSMKFDLKLNGDDLTGGVVRERDGQLLKATLQLKRAR